MHDNTKPKTTAHPAPTGKLLFTVPETCESLGISRSTLYALIRSGKLHTVKIGERGIRIP